MLRSVLLFSPQAFLAQLDGLHDQKRGVSYPQPHDPDAKEESRKGDEDRELSHVPTVDGGVVVGEARRVALRRHAASLAVTSRGSDLLPLHAYRFLLNRSE